MNVMNMEDGQMLKTFVGKMCLVFAKNPIFAK